MIVKNSHNSAFTLLEILLAAIIFTVSIAGVFVTLDAMRRPVADKESSLSAAVFGKQVLESLRSQVDARTYYSPCSTGTSPCPDFSLSLGQHQVALPQPPACSGSTCFLNWPSQAMSAANNAILSYVVTCADGSSPCNTDAARQVQLNIQWTNAP